MVDTTDFLRDLARIQTRGTGVSRERLPFFMTDAERTPADVFAQPFQMPRRERDNGFSAVWDAVGPMATLLTANVEQTERQRQFDEQSQQERARIALAERAAHIADANKDLDRDLKREQLAGLQEDRRERGKDRDEDRKSREWRTRADRLDVENKIASQFGAMKGDFLSEDATQQNAAVESARALLAKARELEIDAAPMLNQIVAELEKDGGGEERQAIINRIKQLQGYQPWDYIRNQPLSAAAALTAASMGLDQGPSLPRGAMRGIYKL